MDTENLRENLRAFARHPLDSITTLFWAVLSHLPESLRRKIRPKRGDFHPSIAGQLAILLVAFAVAVLVYATGVSNAYRSIAGAYRTDGAAAEASALGNILGKDPMVDVSREPGTPLLEATDNELGQRRFLFEASQEMGLIPEDERFEDYEQPGLDALYRALADAGGQNWVRTPTIELVVEVAQFLPGASAAQSGSMSDAANVRDRTANILAAILAGQPGALDKYQNALATDATGESIEDLDRFVGARFGFVDFLSAGTYFHAAPHDDAEVLRLLFRQTQLSACYDRFIEASPNCPLSREAIEFSSSFLGALISALHAQDTVKYAVASLSLWLGWVQLALLFLFFAMCGLLISRGLERWRYRDAAALLREHVAKLEGRSAMTDRRRVAKALSENIDSCGLGNIVKRPVETCVRALKQRGFNTDSLQKECDRLREREDSTRWSLRWSSRALPALGFIGTVLGISQGLSASDTIVRAQTQAGQAAALSEVAGTLGMAFTTTLLALIFGLITSLLDEYQQQRELDLINDIEGALWPLVDPASLAENEPEPERQ